MFEENISIDSSESWEEDLINHDKSGKLKFPVMFHDELLTIGEIPEQMDISPPKKRETGVKTVDLKVKSSKNKNNLF
jgi:hypothetical protein